VALAWLLAQHESIVPIPGTTKVHRLEENAGALDLELAPQDLHELTEASGRIDLSGDRYPEHMQRWIDR
ncbi:MAG: aldo/keto reductase, partial [Cellulomonadaceae bacterium]|nr:aldo/keto reductase [Cellulomonadaceae bacterium]